MKDIFRYCKKYIAYFLVVFLFSFLFSSCDVKAATVSPDNATLIINHSGGGYFEYININNREWATIPNNRRITDWFVGMYTKDSGFNFIPGQAYTGYLYFEFNIPSQAQITNTSGLYMFSDDFCLPTPTGEETNCMNGKVNYITRFDRFVQQGNYLVLVFDFVAPDLSSSSQLGIGLYSNTTNINLGYSSGGSILQLRLDRFSYYSKDSSGVNTDNIEDSLDNIEGSLGDINDSINNSDSSVASDTAGGFFENFTTDTFGLTAVITAPLNFIKSLTSSSCTPLNVPLPFVDTNLTLPCMSTIYNQYFGGFYTLYQTITTGLIAYWVCVRIFNLVKDFKNPDHDEIEVMDL